MLGIAACNLGGITIHRFAGIGIGIEPLKVLVERVKRNYKAVERWSCTRVLVIDEGILEAR
jgi:ATP-dependent DNA helicase PIF1